MFKCCNPECGRKFHILGRIDEELLPAQSNFFSKGKRVLSAPCCPFCGSKEWEEIQVKEEPHK